MDLTRRTGPQLFEKAYGTSLNKETGYKLIPEGISKVVATHCEKNCNTSAQELIIAMKEAVKEAIKKRNEDVALSGSEYGRDVLPENYFDEELEINGKQIYNKLLNLKNSVEKDQTAANNN